MLGMILGIMEFFWFRYNLSIIFRRPLLLVNFPLFISRACFRTLKPRNLDRKGIFANKSFQNSINFLSLLVERAYAPLNPVFSTALAFP